jgi:hypothetical protein
MEHRSEHGKPRVQLFHACIVGMKNYKESKSEFGTLKNLDESYEDVDKLRNLFLDTLKWDPSDVNVFRDSPLYLL